MCAMNGSFRSRRPLMPCTSIADGNHASCTCSIASDPNAEAFVFQPNSVASTHPCYSRPPTIFTCTSFHNLTSKTTYTSCLMSRITHMLCTVACRHTSQAAATARSCSPDSDVPSIASACAPMGVGRSSCKIAPGMLDHGPLHLNGMPPRPGD